MHCFFNLTFLLTATRPKEHHVFDVLHWIKASFKRVQLDQLQESECLNKDAFRFVVAASDYFKLKTHLQTVRVNHIIHAFANSHSRYRDVTSSFAALAAQTAALSNSKSALYDRDHPSMSMQSRDGLPFCELNEDALNKLRKKLGLQEWVIESSSTEAKTKH